MNRVFVCVSLLTLVLTSCDNKKPVVDSEKDDPPPVSSLTDLLNQSDNEPESTTQDAIQPSFSEVARELGIDFTFYSDTIPDRYYLPEVMGGGVGWLDFDLDGRLDLYMVDGSYLAADQVNEGRYFNRLYRNTESGFQDISLSTGADGLEYGQGVAIGDFDADGFPDIFVANYGNNRLYRNQGDGSFRDVSIEAGFAGSQWSSSTLWLDIDRDGDLDLYVVNYMDVRADNLKKCRYQGVVGYCGPGEYDALFDSVYINNGNGTFVESAEQLGLRAENGKGLAISAMDFDLDGVPEIYVANDMTPNFLFSTRDPFQDAEEEAEYEDEEETQPPSKLYSELGIFSGTAASDVGQPEASMGISAADFDRDGLPDIFLTHFYSHKNTLYRNLGGLIFTDASKTSNIARTSFDTLGFGTVNLDYDLNGAIDLFIANGHVLGPEHPPYEMNPQLLRNDGRGRFEDLTQEAGAYFDGKYLGRGAAGADFDNDGDPDIAVTHIGSPFALLENRSKHAGNWIGFDLVTDERVRPIGSRVELTVDGEKRVYNSSVGGSYLSNPDPRMLIGLGNHSGPIDVEIVWSDGRTTTYDDMDTQRYWQLSPTGPPRDLSLLPE